MIPEAIVRETLGDWMPWAGALLLVLGGQGVAMAAESGAGPLAGAMDRMAVPLATADVTIAAATPLSLAEAVALGLAHNRQLAIAAIGLDRARAAVGTAEAAFLPALDAAARGQVTQRMGNASAATLTPGLTLSYDLGTDGARASRVEIARKEAYLADLEVQRLTLKTRAEVAAAYYDAQLAQEQVRIASASVAYAQQGLQSAEALSKAGIGTVFDVQRATSQAANTVQELVSARGRRLVSSRTLVKLLGLAPSANPVPADPVRLAGEWRLNLEQTILLAMARRPEIRQQRLRRENAGLQLALAESARGLRTSLAAGTDFPASLVAPGLFQEVWPKPGYSLTATVQISLFDGGASAGSVQQAASTVAESEVQFGEAVADLRLQVEQAWTLLESSRQNVETATRALDAGVQALESARARFASGVGTQTEVINAQDDLERAEGNRVGAILDFNGALASLEALTSER